MTIKKKITIGILTGVCGAILLWAFAVFNIGSSEMLLPDMEEQFGKTTSEINDYSPELLQFLFFSLKVISILGISLSIALLILLYGPFKRDLKWATVSIFTPLMVWLVSALLIYGSQPSAPWQIWLVLLFLVIIALILTLTEKNKSV